MSERRISLGLPLLIDYLYWVRDRVLRAADGLDRDEFGATPTVQNRDLRGTLTHELDIEMGWRARLRGDAAEVWEAELDPGQFHTLEALAEAWRADELEMRHWLDALTQADLEAPVTVNRLEGYPMAVYLLHVIEHGVMELTDAAAILASMGRSTGDLGVLDALDDLAPVARGSAPTRDPADPTGPAGPAG